jgi:tetratricopeptide (TPR) repeat protein
VVKHPKPAKDDHPFEIAFFENVLKHAPDFIEAMVALAELYTKEGLYDKGLVLDRRLAALRPDEPVILYNLACSLSLVNDVTGALEAMKRAVACGYEGFEHLEKDPDLINLLTDSDFQEYYRAVKGSEK